MIRIAIHIAALFIAGLGIGTAAAVFGWVGALPAIILTAIYLAWIYVDDYDVIADSITYEPRHLQTVRDYEKGVAG